MSKIKVGLIGFGLSGKVFHTSLLKACEDFEIKKVYSSRVEEVCQTLPEATSCQSLDEIFLDPDIDLVVLTGPNETHYTQAKEALTNGKHVVVEKPFVTNSQQGTELIELAKEKGLVLTVFQNRRLDSDFLTVKKLIAENRLGKIKIFESHFDRWRPMNRKERWKEKKGDGTGILFDLGPHLIDQAIELFGMPSEVFCDLEDQKENEGVVDYFHIILKFSGVLSKMRVILHGSSFSHKSPRFIIQGDKAQFYKEGLDPQESRLSQGLDCMNERFGEEDKAFHGTIFTSDDGKAESFMVSSERGEYFKFYQNLALVLKNNDPSQLLVKAKSANNVIFIIESAIKSSLSKRWVSL